MNRWKWAILTLMVIAIGLMLGMRLGRGGSHSTVDQTPEASTPATTPATGGKGQTAARKVDRSRDNRPSKGDPLPPGAIPGERTVTFANDEAMARFLASLEGTGIRVIGSMRGLSTLRLAVSNASALEDLLDGSEEIGFIFPAEIPGQGSVQPGAVAFGSQYLPWLGATGDRTTWGTDVRVAVLDTGVVPGTPFANTVFHQNLVAMPANPSQINGHGTAVASLIAGENGLAPNASILSYRVAGDDGRSDTYLIAEAVVAATDAGANIINISLGSSGSSGVLQKAVDYAAQAGVVVVASAGNSGVDYLFYPAAYENVVGVGAVDARGEHLDFSNTGSTSIVAPGLGLTANVGENSRISFSGTSASSPVVAGAIALTMSEQSLRATGAWQEVLTYSNDAGAPGVDPAYGSGILDVGRVLNSGVAGITDMAVASNHITTNANGSTVLQVTVQNRGTVPVINAPVTVNTPLGTNHLNVTTLAPGAIQTFELAIGRVDDSTRIESTVGQGTGGKDQNPANNTRVDVLTQIGGQ